jgi:hypothetical protein
VYSREHKGRTLTFGVSGKLWKNALVMYDRETRTLWSHLTGEALEGPMAGEELTILSSVPKVKWKEWKARYPNTTVLSVGGREDQRNDNYRDYHGSSRTGLFSPENRDKRLREKDRVIGVIVGSQQKAYSLKKKLWKTRKKGEWRLVQDQIGDVPVLVFHDPENYATAVYDRRLEDGSVLEFTENAQGYRAADATGGQWNLLTGEGSEDKTLTPLPHVGIYWFAWTDFYPETLLHKEQKK